MAAWQDRRQLVRSDTAVMSKAVVDDRLARKCSRVPAMAGNLSFAAKSLFQNSRSGDSSLLVRPL